MRHLSTDLRRPPPPTTNSTTTNTPSPPRQYRHPNLPPLFYLVTSRNWNTVLRRIRTHPHEIPCAEYTSGDTPLHYACRLNPPVEVVRALSGILRCETNREGATPLHVAASHRCSAVVIGVLVGKDVELEDGVEDGAEEKEEDLVSASLLPLSLTNIGRAPLHYACLSFRGLDVVAFRILLDATIDACVLLERRRYLQDRALLTTDTASAGMMEYNHHEEEKDEKEDVSNDDNDNTTPSIQKDDTNNKQPHHKATTNHQDEPPQQQQQEQQNDLEWDDVTDVAHQQANAFTMQDHSGQTPLSLLFRRYRERVRCVIHQLERNNRNGIPGATTASTTISNGRIRRREGATTTTTTTPMTSAIAASAVQDELGELWQKARLMVCLMAEKRLEREREEELSSLSCIVETGIGGGIGIGIGGGIGDIGGDVGDPSSMMMMRQASAAAAVAMEAAKWAKQQHQHRSDDDDNADDDDILTDGYATMDGAAGNNTTTGNAGARRTTRKFRLVHASVGLTGYGCPPEMIRLAASVYPNQVREMDEDGNLPLHIAAVASSFLPTPPPTATGTEEGLPSTISDDDSLLSTISGLSATTNSTALPSPNPFDTIIRMLLRIYPGAVRIPHGTTGRLPLAMAIEGRKRTMDDGIRALLESHPAALESMDINPKLYPKILAVVGEPKETTKKVTQKQRWGGGGRRLRRKNVLVQRNIPTALFEVLKAKPGLVSIGGGLCTASEGLG